MKPDAAQSSGGRRRPVITTKRALAILDEVSVGVLDNDLSAVLDRILEAALTCTGADEGSVSFSTTSVTN